MYWAAWAMPNSTGRIRSFSTANSENALSRFKSSSAAFRRCSTSSGSPLGAAKTTYISMDSSHPCSRSVGISGSSVRRTGVDAARQRIFPLCT